MACIGEPPLNSEVSLAGVLVLFPVPGVVVDYLRKTGLFTTHMCEHVLNDSWRLSATGISPHCPNDSLIASLIPDLIKNM